MAVTQNTYTGDGATVLFSFTFPYLESADIKVSLNGVITTAYTLANATTVQFNTAPSVGAAVRIYRKTEDATLAATFYPGSAIRSQDLNENFTQNLYVTQEVNNYSVLDIGNVTLSANYTFTGTVVGLTPTASAHFATKGYVDGIALSGTIPDGNRGDITVSSSGSVWVLNQTYLTTASAATTYLTQSNAAATYSSKSTAIALSIALG